MNDTVFSSNGEEYNDDADYIKDNIENDTETIYVADKIEKTHSAYLNIDNLLESMADRAWDDANELAESYCDTLNKIDKDHKKNIEKLIIDYMNKHISQPSFYHVDNVRKISVEQFKKEHC